MEIEQLIKQVDWLDEERRKDKLRLGALEERLPALEAELAAARQLVKENQSEITRLAALLARVETNEEQILQLRVETKQQFDERDKLERKRHEDAEKVRRTDVARLDTAIVDLRKDLDQIPDLKRSIKVRIDEESRLARLIDEVRARIDTLRRSEEEYTRTIRLMDDGRRQDTKRLTDLTGETTAMRKRVDDQGGRLELVATTLKKVETRLNEVAAIETERRETISGFLDNQALREVERERVWKEWQSRFQTIESQTTDLENMLQTLEATDRAVKRSQQAVEELNQKAERRINEITEIQRLAEERFRQEWVTFKADDQKRWTNYTLTLEEQRGEGLRQQEKLSEKVTLLEDTIQEVQDLIGQMNEQTEKRLQSLLAMTHEWTTAFERTIGRAR